MTATAIQEPARRPRFVLRREYGLLVLFLLLMFVLAVGVEHFYTQKNLLRVLRDQAHLGILAVGMTLVILTGGIDLSVGSATALAAVSMGLAWKATGSIPVAVLAALGTGALCGALNGVLVAAGRVPALIVTLATLSVYRGAAFALAGNQTLGRFDPAILAWSRGDFLGFPIPFWITLGLFVGAAFYLARTDGGRAIYATGANATAARLSGIPVDPLKFRLYLVSGLLAGLAALLYAARNDNVKPDIGAEYELMAITMVVLGGISVSGGEGSVVGAALGYLTLIFLQNGMTLKGELPLGGITLQLTELQGVVVAALLVGALLLDARIRRARAG